MNNCLYCGKPVKNKYCNVSCQNKFQKRKPTIEQCKRAHNTRFGEIKKFIVVCETCKKEFEVLEREKLYPQKEKYYCSRSCANTRHHSEETKNKISRSIINIIVSGSSLGFIKQNSNTTNVERKKYKKSCGFCNKEFETTRETKRFCSKLCARKNNIKLASVAQCEKMKNNPGWWSQVQKTLYASGKQYVAGGTTKWYTYKNICVQGTYELRTCFILDKCKEKQKIKNWEYTNDRIEYIGLDNKKHTYLLDFKVFENDNTFYYIEVKGYTKDNDELKWQATRNKGYKLVVWFNEDIIKKEKELGVVV